MPLTLHNTLTKKTEVFTPLDGNHVTLYTCGPTVYHYLTVGNWTAYIYWDILVRTLRADGYDVTRVMNITDVGHLVSDEDEGEDKLEKGARREGKTAWEIAKFYADDFKAGMKKLNMITPEHLTPATEYIPEQLDLVRTLKEKGYTYQITDGIYFDSSKFPTYADFAGLDLAAQRAGARVEFNPEKRNPSDFALWKFTPKGTKRDMEWETPEDLLDAPSKKKVMGFPGWHIECSAMAMNLLGETIDIHTGGIDHIPVHHTNEIAQSESASGKQFARFWVHSNHIKVNGTKISKSLGNGYTLQDLAKKHYEPMDLRMFILQGQYSNEGNFTFENLTAAKNRLHHWRNMAALRHQTYDTIDADDDKEVILVAARSAMLEALNDDLNTPEALRIVDESFARLDKVDTINQHGLQEMLEAIDELLGLNLLGTTPDIDDDTKALIVKRERAREEKDWTLSDQIRDELIKKHHISVRDTPNGTIWEYAEKKSR
jgi:cysteinyl-tRNA synthetase